MEMLNLVEKHHNLLTIKLPAKQNVLVVVIVVEETHFGWKDI